eukprot:2630002-Alexandrium_andersonii.AAC.1
MRKSSMCAPMAPTMELPLGSPNTQMQGSATQRRPPKDFRVLSTASNHAKGAWQSPRAVLRSKRGAPPGTPMAVASSAPAA